jgi:alkylation response protein AidB-like acyl-CoA dehydrogenase
VDVGFSDSQLELRAAVRDVLSKECPPALVRTCLDDHDAWRPLWQTFVDLGWTALALFDDTEGLGVIELVAVLEELGAAAAPAPLLSSVGLAAAVLRDIGAPARRWQEEIARGAVAALAAPDRTTSLTISGNHVRGTVDGVADASRAQLFVALAFADDGSAHAAVVRAGDGVALHPTEAVDPSRPVARLAIDVDADATFTVEVPSVLSLPLTAAAAEMVGLAARVLDIAVGYAGTREQFDRVIGSFQGVKHALADCYVSIERARGLTYAAAMLVADPDANTDERWRAAALAKAAAGDAATETARAAVQVHGALGMTWEHDLHLYLRRAWQSATLLGDSPSLYRAAASSLVGSG